MSPFRVVFTCVVLGTVAWSQGTSGDVGGAAQRFDEAAAKASGDVRVELRLMAAQSLQPKYPELSSYLMSIVVKDIAGARDVQMNNRSIQKLAALAPDDA